MRFCPLFFIMIFFSKCSIKNKSLLITRGRNTQEKEYSIFVININNFPFIVF